MVEPHVLMPALSTRIILPGIHLTKPAVIALIGAGGKTTSLFRLACWLKAQGNSVLLTTTTRMFQPDKHSHDHALIVADPQELFQRLLTPPIAPSITFCCAQVDPQSNKVQGIDSALIDRLKLLGTYSVILVEADGARQLPLKAPDKHEPQIPASTDWVIAVTGAEEIGSMARPERIHRWPLFAKRMNIAPGALLDAELFCRWINHPQGLFKDAPANAQRTWLINKVSDSRLYHLFLFARQVMQQRPQLDSLWLAGMREPHAIKYCTLKTKS